MNCFLFSNVAIFVPLIQRFCSCRFSIISTGGTASSLEAAGVNVTKVEEITHFPEMVKPNSCLIVPTFLEIHVAVTVSLPIPG